MTVIGVDAVDDAASAGRLIVGPHDRVTPLARDRAAELGVELLEGAPIRSDSRRDSRKGLRIPTVRLEGGGSLPEPPVPALTRRGAPVPGRGTRGQTRERGAAAGRRRVERVTIVGAGNVGTHAAMRLAETDLIDEIVLVDIAEGLAAGVALDLTHAAGLLGFTTRVRGATSVEQAGTSAYTILTAGKPRQPGMSRTDLTSANARIVEPVAHAIGATSPDGVLVVVTNPLDEMTELAWTASGLASERVIGMAGLLDSSRFQSIAADRLDLPPLHVSSLALGSHGDEMLIPLSQVTVDGRPADRASRELAGAVDRTRNAGAEVVSLLGKGSAFITPGLAAARMVESMIIDDRRLVSATVRPRGEFGLRDVYVGLPVRLGRAGVAEIVEVALTSSERTALHDASTQIRQRVDAIAASTAG